MIVRNAMVKIVLINFLCVLTLINAPGSLAAQNDQGHVMVKIAVPFIELHSGPANGYPIFYVVKRGQEVSVMLQRTSWYKVMTSDGVTGWVTAAALGKTEVASNNLFSNELRAQTPYLQRDFEFGVTAGTLGDSSALGAKVSWQFTQTLSASLNVDQALGDVSENRIASISIAHQPFTKWSYSPYFAIGVGIIDTKPRTPLIGSGDEKRRSDALTFSVGVKKLLTRNFVLSLEYKNISALTNRDETEELDQWTTGFSVYF